MKKNVFIIALICMLFAAFSGCSDLQNLKSAAAVMEQTLKTATNTEITVTVNYDEEKYKSNFDMLYGIDKDLVSDGSIAYAERGMSADEISLLIASSDENAAKIEAALKSRIQQRKNDFNGYAPEEVKKLDSSLVVKSGRYVALIICDNPFDVRTILLNAIR